MLKRIGMILVIAVSAISCAPAMADIWIDAPLASDYSMAEMPADNLESAAIVFTAAPAPERLPMSGQAAASEPFSAAITTVLRDSGQQFEKNLYPNCLDAALCKALGGASGHVGIAYETDS